MKTLNSYKVSFFGRTGNGKSTLINLLFGTHFQTDPDLPCTKELNSATFMENVGETYEAITIYDTPGTGEFSNNTKYFRFYEHAVAEADCVVVVVTLDRTDAPVQRLLIALNEVLGQKERRYVFAINHIDSNSVTSQDRKYRAWDDETDCPTLECLENIAEKKEILKKNFEKYIPGPFEIVEVCGKRGYNIETLKSKILNK